MNKLRLVRRVSVKTNPLYLHLNNVNFLLNLKYIILSPIIGLKNKIIKLDRVSK